MGELRPWHVAVLVAVIMLLFGAKRLPGAARSLGQSMRILKAETQGLREDDAAATQRTASNTITDRVPEQHPLPATQPVSHVGVDQPAVANPRP